METKQSNTKQETIKHESYLRHRRQSTWQIYLPIIIGSLLILAAAVIVFLPVAGVPTGVDGSQYADAALNWLILPLLFLAVMILIIMVGLIILFAKILQTLPGYSKIGQDYAAVISSTVQYWSGRLVSPIMKLKSRMASFKPIINSLSREQED